MNPQIKSEKHVATAYAATGHHCLADFYDASFLDDVSYIENAMVAAAKECGATIIGQNFHKFGGAGGVTGVLLLAESHISIHTWPETGYAAIDIFMCGDAKVEKAVAVLKSHLKPGHVAAQVINRGQKDAVR